MELAVDLHISKVRCSPFHGSQAADPIGSAGTYDAFLCVEIPLPWEPDISQCEPFRSLMERSASVTGADGRRWRPVGLVPRVATAGATAGATVGAAADGGVTVLALDRPPGPVGPFRRREWRVRPGSETELCRALLEDDPAAIRRFDVDRRSVPEDTVDLLVCTHGRRDACCGSLGTAVHQELQGMLARESTPDGQSVPAVRLWRCSHTGGHRFAPTGLTFPDGYAWAHLTAGLAARLVGRHGSPADFAPHCRGNALLDGGPAQAADRAALVESGWDWLRAERTAQVVAFERDTMATTVRVDGTLADGRVAAYEVRVELERHIPMPTCGEAPGPEYAVEPVWRVASVLAR